MWSDNLLVTAASVRERPGSGSRPGPRRCAAAILAAAVLVLTGCGTEPADVAATVGGGTGTFPVTVESCGDPVTFDAAPARAVVNDDNMIEIMFALGLTDRMAAYSGAGPRNRLPEFADDYAAVTSLGEDYFALEPLLGARPDFVFAGWNYGFSESTGLTPRRLADLGVPSYVLNESCRRIDPSLPPSSVAELQDDVRNIAAIFGVPERADALIEDWDARVATVAASLPPQAERDQTVFTYLSGDDAPGTAPGLTIVPELNRLAGGTNVFTDLPQMWGKVSWEAVVERDPDVIVVVDYGDSAVGGTGEAKVEFLRALPVLAEVSAVREDRFLILPQEAVNPGIRYAEGIERLAAVLYPGARGS